MPDTTTEHASAADLLSLTADIVVAFLANNKLDPVAVPEVISATHAALLQLTAPQVEAITEPALEKPNRAAIRKSVTEEGIVSFLDGKMYRTLKGTSARGATRQTAIAKHSGCRTTIRSWRLATQPSDPPRRRRSGSGLSAKVRV